MTGFAPRLLWPESEAELRRELLRIGVAPPDAAQLAADSTWRLIRLSAVPVRLVALLRREMQAIGGELAALSAPADAADVILAGTLPALALLRERLSAKSGMAAALAAELSILLNNLESPPGYLAGRNCRLSLDRPRIMGILNVTPDSFSDGGCYSSLECALRRGLELAAEGADIIDIGGESTRPGAALVGLQEELDRVAPVIEALSRETSIPLSIDTSKAAVARAAVAAGAEFVNDISGLQFDPDMAETVAATGAGLFLMHTRGRPEQMQQDTAYADLLGEVADSLREGIERAASAGVPLEKIAIDPGIGFGKSVEGNLEILRRLPELKSLGHPVLLGTSRKSFIGRIIDQIDPQQRLAGSLATVALGVQRGALIFRVHDVRPSREAALMAWAICRGAKSGTD